MSIAKGDCPKWLRLDCKILDELNIKIIDLRNRNYIDIINTINKEYMIASAARERKIVELTTPQETTYPYQVGWAVISDTDIKRLYIKTLDYILTYGILKNNKLISYLIIQNISYKSKELRNVIRECNVMGEWPCGLTGNGFEAVILTPAYVSIEDIALARATVKQSWRAAYSADILDTRGNFVLAPPRLLHCTPEGALYRESELDEVSVRREASKLFPEHAFYLGREFSAYKILRDRYSQEKWRLALDQG
jgi:thymidylate synthase